MAFDGIVNAVGRAINVPVDRETADGRFYARMILRGYATLLDEMRETIAAIPKQVQASVDSRVPMESTPPRQRKISQLGPLT
jgi:hypothetical protein